MKNISMDHPEIKNEMAGTPTIHDISLKAEMEETSISDHVIKIEKSQYLESGTLLYAENRLESQDDDHGTTQQWLVSTCEEGEQKPHCLEGDSIAPQATLHPQTEHDKNNTEEKIDAEGSQHKCEFCEATFPEPSSLDDHRNHHLEVQKLNSTQCYLCFNNYKSRKILNSHILLHTSPFKCVLCGKRLQSAYSLRIHIQRHKGIKPHQCKFCEAAFPALSELNAHLKNHTAAYKFDQSGGIFQSAYKLDHQTRGNQGMNPHRCTACKAAFASASDLKRHEQIHSEIYEGIDCEQEFLKLKGCKKSARSFKCEYCGKTFQNLRYQEMHIRRHLGIKTHKCTECQAAFVTAYDLKKHTKKHFRRHNCDLCDRSFLKTSALETHRKVHTWLHKCTFCTDTFSAYQGLRRHLRIKHKTEINFSRAIAIQNQQQSLKAAICLDDDQEFKPIVEVADEVTDVPTFHPDTTHQSLVAASPTGQEKTLNSRTEVHNESCHAIKIENTEMPEEEKISQVISYPIKVEKLHEKELQEEGLMICEKKIKSEIDDSFDVAQPSPRIKTNNTPPLDAEDEADLSENLEFLSEDEEP